MRSFYDQIRHNIRVFCAKWLVLLRCAWVCYIFKPAIPYKLDRFKVCVPRNSRGKSSRTSQCILHLQPMHPCMCEGAPAVDECALERHSVVITFAIGPTELSGAFCLDIKHFSAQKKKLDFSARKHRALTIIFYHY